MEGSPHSGFRNRAGRRIDKRTLSAVVAILWVLAGVAALCVLAAATFFVLDVSARGSDTPGAVDADLALLAMCVAMLAFLCGAIAWLRRILRRAP